ncbi:MAG: hypothetical protein KDK39_18740 [Leptospiraceae bacterium]|nr:hypothetical protein [Leptospiraceae bacterium]
MTELQYTAASCLSPPVAGPILSAASVPLEFTTLRGEFKLPALGDQPNTDFIATASIHNRFFLRFIRKKLLQLIVYKAVWLGLQGLPAQQARNLDRHNFLQQINGLCPF